MEQVHRPGEGRRVASYPRVLETVCNWARSSERALLAYSGNAHSAASPDLCAFLGRENAGTIGACNFRAADTAKTARLCAFCVHGCGGPRLGLQLPRRLGTAGHPGMGGAGK